MEEVVTQMNETKEIKKETVKEQNVVVAVETMEARQTKAVRHHVIVVVPLLLTT